MSRGNLGASAAEDEEWEETLVYVDLGDVPNPEALFPSISKPEEQPVDGSENEPGAGNSDKNSSSQEVKVYNLDSELPVLFIDGKYLAGHWEDAVGTSLFFRKKENDRHQEDQDAIPPHSSSQRKSGPLKNIVPEPEIPFDPLFGEALTSGDDGYELVAKSFKVLKIKQFPVVNEDLKGEDVIRDADNEFDPRDFQIPPASMVRELFGSKMNFESYLEQDIERRRKIRELWSPEKPEDNNDVPFIKPEPVDLPDQSEDYFDADSPCILNDDDEPSQS